MNVPPDPMEGTPFAGAWLFVEPSALPEELRARAVPMALLVLQPGESVTTGRGAMLVLDDQDLAVARLLARGLSHADIATELHLSLRTVERRLSRLRERFGVRTGSQLAAELARRGVT